MWKRINWDALGITTSLACAIHCAVLPLVISSLPIFGFNIIENDRFEYFMIFLAFSIGFFALMHGYKRHHHNSFPLLMFTVGIMLLVAKQLFHSIHLWLLVPSVLLIVSAHFLNFRLFRKVGHSHAEAGDH